MTSLEIMQFVDGFNKGKFEPMRLGYAFLWKFYDLECGCSRFTEHQSCLFNETNDAKALKVIWENYLKGGVV